MVPRHTPGISWWAAYTTHMLRVSLVYILIYGSILGIHAYPHKLRHFFADNAHEAGIDVLNISRMLGHESVETTKIYMSLNTDDLAHKHNKLR